MIYDVNVRYSVYEYVTYALDITYKILDNIIHVVIDILSYIQYSYNSIIRTLTFQSDLTVMTLQQLFDHHQIIFAAVNSYKRISVHYHMGMILVMEKELADAMRKRKSQEEFSHILGKLIGRIFAFAGYFHQLPLTTAMCQKYPQGLCAYCTYAPCRCNPVARSEHKQMTISASQLLWTLKNHQESLENIYGPGNSYLTDEQIWSRLMSETIELNELVIGYEHGSSNAETLQKEYAAETADVLAWTLAFSERKRISAEQAYLNLYADGCFVCKKQTCTC
jgi:NTP pyrophosphatase (non-canonical NTP hydrolase)